MPRTEHHVFLVRPGEPDLALGKYKLHTEAEAITAAVKGCRGTLKRLMRHTGSVKCGATVTALAALSKYL